LFSAISDGGVHVSSGVRLTIEIEKAQNAALYQILSDFSQGHRLPLVQGSAPTFAAWQSRDVRVDWRYLGERPTDTGGVLAVFGFNRTDDWQAIAVEIENLLKTKFPIKNAELQLDPREYDCQPVCNGRQLTVPLSFSELKRK
jgi:hypothetical protein